jgi:Domain of unknown function (DUF4190)
VSEVSQGPGWWLASDGRWYPPEQVPGYAPTSGPDAAFSSGQAVDPTTTFDAGPGVPVPPTGATPAGFLPPADPGYGPPPGPADYGPAPGQPGSQPGYPPPADPGYGPPPGPPGYAPPYDAGYGYPPGGTQYGYVPVRKTNGMAVASLVCSLVWLGGLGSILAVIFGFMARAQIKKSEGSVQGSGLALAGIIIGFVGLVAVILTVILVVAVVHHCDQTGDCTTNTYNFGN